MVAAYLSDAIATCEKALKGDADFAQACQTLGNILQSMGKFDEALGWHTRARQSQPDIADTYTSLGSLYTIQQQWEEAIASYEQVLHLEPGAVEARFGIGEVFSKIGKPQEALETWFNALTLEPALATPDAHCDLGNLLFKWGKFTQAAACYQRALERNANSVEALHNLGEILVFQGRWHDAIACYQQAMKQNPDASWAHHKLGDVLSKQGKFDEAVAAYRQAIALNPDFPWSHHNLIEALHRQGLWQEAIAASRAAIAHNRDMPWAYTQLGRALVQAGQPALAMACHHRACKLRGWPQCGEKNYQFTEDWFSHNLPIWEKHLHHLAGLPDIQIVEIGSFQGMSACWFLDKILTHPTARLTCIDPSFHPQFDGNLQKTGASEKVTKLVGQSHAVLPSLPPGFADVVYIDGCHLADYVYHDAAQAWRLLKIGGLIIFDDYEWTDPNYPDQDPKLAIDKFVTLVQSQIELLHKDYQVIIKRLLP
jgi:tetratricopeptide (TPR) repeat protein/predicted O-methyltransferase YrrM